jgi:hypothetical protein
MQNYSNKRVHDDNPGLSLRDHSKKFWVTFDAWHFMTFSKSVTVIQKLAINFAVLLSFSPLDTPGKE